MTSAVARRAGCRRGAARLCEADARRRVNDEAARGSHWLTVFLEDEMPAVLSGLAVMRAALLLVVAATATITAEAGVPERFVAGTHYEMLPAAVTTRDAAKIEVVEAFSYACPHCYSFEPLLDAWRKGLPADVDFQRVPAVWNSDFKLLGQGYYAAAALGLLEATHAPLFRALHVDRENISNADALTAFYVRHGATEADFRQMFASFGIRAQVQQASARIQAYRVTGVPTLIVNGKYKVDGAMAGSQQGMLEIAQFLIEKERATRASAAPAAGG